MTVAASFSLIRTLTVPPNQVTFYDELSMTQRQEKVSGWLRTAWLAFMATQCLQGGRCHRACHRRAVGTGWLGAAAQRHAVLRMLCRAAQVTSAVEAKRLAFYLFYNVKTDFER